MGIEKGKYEHAVPIDKIDLAPEKNVRKTNLTKNLDELKDSMLLEGLLQPIVVAPKNDRYELIIGQRRYLAAKELKWNEIPAIIMDGPIDKIKAIKMSIAENQHRVGLFDEDVTKACKALYDLYGSHKSVAKELGISEDDAADIIGLLDAPEEVKGYVRTGKLPKTKAIDFVAKYYPDEKETIKAAKEWIGGDLTKEEKRRFAKIIRKEGLPVEKAKEKAKIPPKETILKRIVLPTEQYARLEKARKTRGDEKPADTARTAIIDWLDIKGY